VVIGVPLLAHGVENLAKLGNHLIGVETVMRYGRVIGGRTNVVPVRGTRDDAKPGKAVLTATELLDHFARNRFKL
jgi:hypothetical protein